MKYLWVKPPGQRQMVPFNTLCSFFSWLMDRDRPGLIDHLCLKVIEKPIGFLNDWILLGSPKNKLYNIKMYWGNQNGTKTRSITRGQFNRIVDFFDLCEE